MRFTSTLIRGTLTKRYKRFLADVVLDSGAAITCTVPNTGSMMGLARAGFGVWLSESDSPTRKYRHTLELVEVPPTGRRRKPVLVGINTGHPNRIVRAAIEAGQIPPLAGYETLKPEVKYGANSRIDILLSDPGKPTCYVEIKNVHLLRTPGLAEFPDSVTERGAKHLAELSNMVANGHRAVMIYLIQRGDCDRFGLAADIDPAYVAAFKAAHAAGVEAIACRCDVTTTAITVADMIPIEV